MHLDTLRQTLKKSHEHYLFPCVTDLVTNGLSLERFANEKSLPSRQDITQYLASWFKYTELSADECKEWLIEYCAEQLSSISSSSKSQIRHSTRSNIKFIYNSEVIFNCHCENNRFKAHCEQSCPIYNEMAQLAIKSEMAAAEKSKNTIWQHVDIEETKPPKTSPQEEYKDQFAKALEFAQEQINKQHSKKQTVVLLNNNGFKTKTGKNWSYSTLGTELQKLRKKREEKRKEKQESIAQLLSKN